MHHSPPGTPRATPALTSRRAAGAWLLSALAVLPLAATAQSGGLEPAARQRVEAATRFLAAQRQFSVEARSSLEVVLASGQKIEFNQSTRLAVQRPDKLRAERRGDVVEQNFVYDGRSLVLQNPREGVYAQVSAPATLDAALDFARQRLDVIAPGGDLIHTNAYQILMDGVTEGFTVGKAVIEGVRCDHLAFRAPHVDWQIWIEEGAQPLPRRLVITTRDVVNAPQFALTITRWNLKPAFDATTFTFAPPAGARKVEFLPR